MKGNSQETPQSIFTQAGDLYTAGRYEAAAEKYLAVTQYDATAPFAYYRLAAISNITKDPVTAKSLYYKAFKQLPNICEFVLPKEHPNNNYVFRAKKDEPPVEKCPLCEGVGVAHWCYVLPELYAHYVQKYNPVRLWMYCDTCHHMYAEEFPLQKAEPLPDLNSNAAHKSKPMATKPNTFSYFSTVLSKLANIRGNRFLEIGIGGSEFALAAQEMGYDVFGVDIDAANVLQAHKYGINAEVHDFMEFETDKKWDIIVMGDVIEHVSDPVVAMKKVHQLLDDEGALWISTPNFDGAFARMAGHDDPMRRVANHKNYFSRNSFLLLLEKSNFTVVDYTISAHYNGSMELIVVKG